MPNTPWDKRTERRINHTDHDTLVELVTIIKNQTESAKLIATNLEKHEMKDEHNFETIRKDILGLQKVVWTGVGIIVAMDAIPRIGEVIHFFK